MDPSTTADGRLIPTEVRLLRLPAEGQNLIRASIIDNTERKRAERALRESEEKFRALFEGSSQGVVLHDENEILEVNPAAVRILGCQSPQELLGKHPRELAPPFQPNGESSDVMARKHIEECMTNGSARFEWLACAPDGREIPLEVALTRIQWSGRQIIQAFITDITERKRAQTALAESEARFSAPSRPARFSSAFARMSDGAYVLVNDAFVNWTRLHPRGNPRAEHRPSSACGRTQEEREAVLDGFAPHRFDPRTGSAACEIGTASTFTMLLSAEIIQTQRRAAHARHGPRHHRAETSRRGVAGQRGAVARERSALQRGLPGQPGFHRHSPR